MSIEGVNSRLDQVGEYVEDYGERMIGVAEQPPFDSLVARAQQAAQLAEELTALVGEIATDTKGYLLAYIPYLIGGDEFRALLDTVEGATAQTTDDLARTMPIVNVSMIIPASNVQTDMGRLFREVPTYRQAIADAGSGMSAIAAMLPVFQQKLADNTHTGVAKVQDHIQANKL